MFEVSLRRVLALFVILLAPIGMNAWADDEDEDDEEDGLPTIEKTTEDFEKSDGLFPIYRDPESGDIYMEIASDQLDTDFIATTYSENGVSEVGHFRGQYRDDRIIKVQKYYNRLEFVEPSTSFVMDPESPLIRAFDANMSPAVVAAADITAQTTDDDETRYLIEATGLFLGEGLVQIKPSPDPDAADDAFEIGSIDRGRSKITRIRNYPDNTDVIVDYVFGNKYPSEDGPDAVTNPRAVTVTVQHSFLAMPEPGFEPRLADYRVGYFTEKKTDLLASGVEAYGDVIQRWRLEKADPDAAISDPVKPITFWIENTTPLEFRDGVRDGVLIWNTAFEKAGISNALEVKVQPDDAEWDAGDARYNVLRWAASPDRLFSGYGPSFVNPRTGEILGADIMLEYHGVVYRRQIGGAFGGEEERCADLRLHHCFMRNGINASVRLAQAVGDVDDDTLTEIERQFLIELVAHEVGHTLGLTHNFKASALHGPREIHNPAVTKGQVVSSVMDYADINLAPIGVEQGDYFATDIGPYDRWVIEFGYRPELDDDARKALLARSVEPALAYGNDADAITSTSGIDPRIARSDLSSDPIAYAIDRIELAKASLQKLSNKTVESDSYASLRDDARIVLAAYRAQTLTIARWIGGIYSDNASPQDPGAAEKPFQPVSRATQKNAMEALAEHVFAPDAFAPPPELITKLKTQRRDFDFWNEPEDPKVLGDILTGQKNVLNQVLSPVVLTRMSNAAQYGGDYSPAELMMDLNEAIFGADLRGAPNEARRNLQIAYAKKIVSVANGGSYDSVAQSAALLASDDIKKRLGFFSLTLSPDARAHRLHVRRVLKRLG